MPGTAQWRVASYNVHACIGTDGRFCPQRIVEVLQAIGADVIGLQEVEDRDHKGTLVSHFLADQLNMHAYRGPTLKRGRAEYGNLLLSKMPAEVVRARELPTTGREPRGVIEALFPIAASRLKVVTTHLGLSTRERSRQIDAVLNALGDDEADTRVLMGDFNEWRPFSRVNRALREHFGEQKRYRTFPTARPLICLDRILAQSQDRVIETAVMRDGLASVASDHLPVYADLAIA